MSNNICYTMLTLHFHTLHQKAIPVNPRGANKLW